MLLPKRITSPNIQNFLLDIQTVIKYLSKVIKDNSGMSAGEWIDNYVAMEAKALLKSANMTVKQIIDELNFSSQSFFGRYFKRIVGVSPKEYRKS